MQFATSFLDWLGTSYLYAGPIVLLMRLFARAVSGVGMERIAAIIGTIAGLVLVVFAGFFVELLGGREIGTFGVIILLGAMGASWAGAMVADTPRVWDAATAVAPLLLAIVMATLGTL